MRKSRGLGDVYKRQGECVLGNISYESLGYLIAGQLVHIGKNTSMGFGRYVILD